jgi:hypothetical protein
MCPVSAAPNQRFTNQFAFDSGNGMADKPANRFNFGCGEFRVRKERSRHSRSFITGTIAQCRLPQRLNFRRAAADRGKWLARLYSTNSPRAATHHHGQAFRIKTKNM